MFIERKVKRLVRKIDKFALQDAGRAAGEQLQAIRDPKAIGPMVEALGDFRAGDYVKQALEAMNSPLAVEPLVQKLLSDTNISARQSAAQLLGKIRDSRAVDSLTRVLADDSPSAPRTAAARALGEIGDRRAVQPLVQVLGDINSDLRLSAAEALMQMGEPQYKPVVSGTDSDFTRLLEAGYPLAAKQYIKVLDDSDCDEKKRESAAFALGVIKDSQAVGPLIRALTHDGIRYTARRALIEIGNPAAEALSGALADNNWPVRELSAQVLAEIEAPIAVQPLILLLEDGFWAVREAAARALGKQKDLLALKPLLKALDDTVSSVRAAAAQALGKLKDPLAVEPLLKKLDGADYQLKIAIALALGEIKDMRAVQPLIRQLADKFELGEAAAYALGEIGDKQAVEPLIKVIGVNRLGIEAAALALGKLGDPRAVDPLIAALEYVKEGSNIRKSAADALGEIGDRKAVDPLIKALGRDWYLDFDEKIHIINALVGFMDPRTIEPFMDLLGHRNGKVRKTAAQALDSLGQSQWKELILGDDGDYERLSRSRDLQAAKVRVKALDNKHRWEDYNPVTHDDFSF